MKDCNFMIDGKKLFLSTSKNLFKNIRKVTTGQIDHYKICGLLGHPYFEKYSKLITIESSKQQALAADRKK